MEGMHMVPDTGIMALRSPYAVTIWDYISRGMPLNKEGTLSANEVYALTAFLLYKNDVIHDEDEVMDAESLLKVRMPNRDGFASAPEWKHATPRLQGYPY
jgi:S-disulfanyl-L-cysteine oxidoreductase SoxD